MPLRRVESRCSGKSKWRIIWDCAWRTRWNAWGSCRYTVSHVLAHVFASTLVSSIETTTDTTGNIWQDAGGWIYRYTLHTMRRVCCWKYWKPKIYLFAEVFLIAGEFGLAILPVSPYMRGFRWLFQNQNRCFYHSWWFQFDVSCYRYCTIYLEPHVVQPPLCVIELLVGWYVDRISWCGEYTIFVCNPWTEGDAGVFLKSFGL